MRILTALAGALLMCATSFAGEGVTRVPAEWEPQAAVWMQWPDEYEADLWPAFVAIIDVVQHYEPVHLLVRDEIEKADARALLKDGGVPGDNITFHVIAFDNAWMRDNGPIYVTDGQRTRVQDWSFDGWGGNFGAQVRFDQDDAVPAAVAGYLDMHREDRSGYVLEKGNLECNGQGVAVLNWDCQDQRNPGMAQEEHEALLMEALGLTRIIWAYGHHHDDLTTGHIDGIARFADEHTIVISDTREGEVTESGLATACAGAGFTVVRYPGDPNWLVGNGFVLAMSSGDFQEDVRLRNILEDLFSGRDVHLVDASPIADAGGGIHCVTNDQPAQE